MVLVQSLRNIRFETFGEMSKSLLLTIFKKFSRK